MFLHYMCTGLGINKFRSVFSNDLPRNDKIVYEYYSAFINNRDRFKSQGKTSSTGATIGGNYKSSFSDKYLHCVQSCWPRSRVF